MKTKTRRKKRMGESHLRCFIWHEVHYFKDEGGEMDGQIVGYAVNVSDDDWDCVEEAVRARYLGWS